MFKIENYKLLEFPILPEYTNIINWYNVEIKKRRTIDDEWQPSIDKTLMENAKKEYPF